MRGLRGYLASAAGMSVAISVLAVAGSLFMIEVYDRVLPSHSLATLVALLVLIVALYALQALIEGARSMLFARMGRAIDVNLWDATFTANGLSGLPGASGRPVSPHRDLDQLRGFLAGQGPSALFDLPWTPFFILLMALMHPLMGLVGLAGALGLAAIAFVTERMSSAVQQESVRLSVLSNQQTDCVRRGAETLVPMGMLTNLREAWRPTQLAAGDAVLRASDLSTRFGGLSRFVRMTLQSATLALGAYLVIEGHATGGVMLGASILLGRALAPVELAITRWRSFVAARQSYDRLVDTLGQAPDPVKTSLPPPSGRLSVAAVSVAPQERRKPILADLSFDLVAGDALGLIGASGAGKSSLARALVGAMAVTDGSIRLDGARLDQWSPESAGAFIGYLPQGVDLLPGTVAQNISRFRRDATTEAVLAAAQAAGVDTLIRALDRGYDTLIGADSGALSAGQRQRIALARALYGDPFLIVLDEPNSALDNEGEAALHAAVLKARGRGAIVILATHRAPLLSAVNKVLILDNGEVRAFGLRDEVLNRKPVAVPAPPGARAPQDQIP